MSIDKDSLKAGAELLEVVVDTFITPDGLAKDIPVVGTIFSLADACNTFRNKRFAKRVSAFLTNFSPEDFEKFKKAITNKSNEDLGEEILSVIDNLEKEVQVNMVARATKKHIALLEEGHSSESVKYILDHNIHIIKQLDSHLLAGLHAIYGGQNSVRISSVDQGLFNLGLLEMNIISTAPAGGVPISSHSFSWCETGSNFYKYIVCTDE
ncbi:hypothetical protein L2096_07025 [Acinetobacter sp. ACZLY 512]|uniref:hypothetical protein n=1 Tax=Acinetobacter sp. ACZLY 512 TaxID=2911206 RepID=UPI0020264B8F|nr:hypothetical protein [Acinetobacter sp. ACZLY 512]MCL9675977.1 hypothetical protein [Acinetobacter sp. ACZLY 512]MCL9675981.1 hypothetical protein [Acinetobacter sp. ACZLY 512]